MDAYNRCAAMIVIRLSSCASGSSDAERRDAQEAPGEGAGSARGAVLQRQGGRGGQRGLALLAGSADGLPGRPGAVEDRVGVGGGGRAGGVADGTEAAGEAVADLTAVLDEIVAGERGGDRRAGRGQVDVGAGRGRLGGQDLAVEAGPADELPLVGRRGRGAVAQMPDDAVGGVGD